MTNLFLSRGQLKYLFFFLAAMAGMTARADYQERMHCETEAEIHGGTSAGLPKISLEMNGSEWTLSEVTSSGEHSVALDQIGSSGGSPDRYDYYVGRSAIGDYSVSLGGIYDRGDDSTAKVTLSRTSEEDVTYWCSTGKIIH